MPLFAIGFIDASGRRRSMTADFTHPPTAVVAEQYVRDRVPGARVHSIVSADEPATVVLAASSASLASPAPPYAARRMTRNGSDLAPVQGGSPRWVVGLVTIAIGVALALSVLAPWVNMSSSLDSGGQQVSPTASLSGLGIATVHVDAFTDPTENGFVESNAKQALEAHSGTPGAWAIPVGVLAALAGVAFLATRWRTLAAISVAVVGTVGFVEALTWIVGAKTEITAPNWSGGGSASFGLVLACALSLILVGLSVGALVLDRQAVTAATHGPPTPTPVWTDPNDIPYMAPAPANPRFPGMPATFGARYGAFVVDWLVLGFVLFVYEGIVRSIGSALLHNAAATIVYILGAVLLGWAAPVAYFTLCEARTGRTLGKRLAGIRVDTAAGQPPTLGQSWKRNWLTLLYLLPPVYLVIVVVIAIAMSADPQGNPWRQGFHDRSAGGTRVIFAPDPSTRPDEISRPSLTPWMTSAACIAAVMLVAAFMSALFQSSANPETTAAANDFTPSTAAAPTGTLDTPTAPTPAADSTVPTADASTATTASTFVYDCNGNPHVQPSDISSIFCGDDGVNVTNITWQTWGGSQATGRGTENKKLCNPDCADGQTEQLPVTVLLSETQDHGFTKITLTRGDGQSESFSLINISPGSAGSSSSAQSQDPASLDDYYRGLLKQDGIYFASDAAATDEGHRACQLYLSGDSNNQVAAQITQDHPDLTWDQAVKEEHAATLAYCKQFS